MATEKGTALAAEYGLKFFETSAKSNLNVSEAFLTITREVKNRLTASPPSDPNGGGVQITGEHATKSDTNCCGGAKQPKPSAAASASASASAAAE